LSVHIWIATKSRYLGEIVLVAVVAHDARLRQRYDDGSSREVLPESEGLAIPLAEKKNVPGVSAVVWWTKTRACSRPGAKL